MWLWGQPIYVKEKNMYIMFMDCEGFGSLNNNKNENHDAKLFCTSVLISSMIMYNSM